jgi:hypothetical protein
MLKSLVLAGASLPSRHSVERPQGKAVPLQAGAAGPPSAAKA